MLQSTAPWQGEDERNGSLKRFFSLPFFKRFCHARSDTSYPPPLPKIPIGPKDRLELPA